MIERHGYAVRGKRRAPKGETLVVAATETPCADGITLDMSRMDLDQFNTNNPVVCRSHKLDEWPIGRAKAWIDGRLLMARIFWDMADEYGAAAARKFASGVLNAVSITFDGIDASGMPTRQPGEVDHWLLYEISPVAVPMDPNAVAVRQARQRGFVVVRPKVDLSGVLAGLDKAEKERRERAEVRELVRKLCE